MSGHSQADSSRLSLCHQTDTSLSGTPEDNAAADITLNTMGSNQKEQTDSSNGTQGNGSAAQRTVDNASVEDTGANEGNNSSQAPPARTNSRRRENSNESDLDEKTVENLMFYTNQVHKIIGPICCCIAIAIFWVKMAQYSATYKPAGSSLTYFQETSNSSSSQLFAGALLNALIIICAIIVFTIVFVILFYFNCMKLIFAYLMFVVFALLGFFGGLVELAALDVFNIPMDWITIAIFIFNFAFVGVLTVFWEGPLWLQQGYLVMMSAMMAYSLTGLQEWTSWTLLAVLAVWDLIAVLCPFGPLKLLVETSRNQNREIPALLYSDGVPPSSRKDALSIGGSRDDSVESSSYLSDEQSMSSHRPPSSLMPQRSISSAVHQYSDDETDTNRGRPLSFTSGFSHDNENSSVSNNKPGSVVPEESINEYRGQNAESINNGSIQETAQSTADGGAVAPRAVEENRSDSNDDDDERSGLKLGLGDFVFYSVLVSRAAVYDWVTTLACVVAVLTGFTMTIYLLAIFRKALPALPISIAFGMIFFFLCSFMVIPYMNSFGLLGIQP